MEMHHPALPGRTVPDVAPGQMKAYARRGWVEGPAPAVTSEGTPADDTPADAAPADTSAADTTPAPVPAGRRGKAADEGGAKAQG